MLPGRRKQARAEYKIFVYPNAELLKQSKMGQSALSQGGIGKFTNAGTYNILCLIVVGEGNIPLWVTRTVRGPEYVSSNSILL